MTPALVALVTLAANCCVAPRTTLEISGERESVTAGMFTVAVVAFVLSACEVAVTVTVAGVCKLAGAA